MWHHNWELTRYCSPREIWDANLDQMVHHRLVVTTSAPRFQSLGAPPWGSSPTPRARNTPIPGYYFFEFQLLIAVPVANWGTVQLSFYKNGVNVNQANSSRGLSYYWVNNVDPGPDSFSHLNTPSCRAILYLNRGDYVQAGYPGIGSSTASSSFEYSKNYAFFQGYLLST